MIFKTTSVAGLLLIMYACGHPPPGKHRVGLAWKAPAPNGSACTDTCTFNIYRATGSSAPVKIADHLTGRVFLDDSVTALMVYTYQVTAVDPITGDESVRSNSFVAAVPQ